jgi:DNA topoisomerase VI subunit B
MDVSTKNPGNRAAICTASTEIQQAENQPKGPRFLQIVAEPDQPATDQPTAGKPKHKLIRVAFTVSRLMEFCSKRELENQTSHSFWEWPLVVLKELFDNALDACEEFEVAPIIEVVVRPGFIAINDNAGGIAAATITSILDYTIRVSSREAYVSPTRGAQGNALKTILAMAYVLDRERDGGDINADAVGVTIIESRGIRHRIEFKVDHIKNEPKIVHTTTPCDRMVGTKITVEWPNSDQLLDYAASRFKYLAASYVFFNPHLSLRAVWHGKQFINVAATNPNWQKWGPRDPTSPHWYNDSRLQRYLAAHVARDLELGRDRTVREFIAEFRGLSGTAVQRKILAEVGCSHQSLAQFFGVEQVNRAGIAKLLAAMKRYSKPVNPKLLGIIGADHFKECFLTAGGNAETFKYEQRKGMTEADIPYVIEVAFGLHQSGLQQQQPGTATETRKIVEGVNWSVALGNPFRSFGSTGEGLDNTLAQVRANAREPVICAVHLASAHVQYADRGKSSIILTDDARQPE